ncbi:MAG TPA: hypothetical protein VFL77_09265 [Solirubrobacterales bacterium]|nr:hypothetical protein [Solirubrobacterales bacterium]
MGFEQSNRFVDVRDLHTYVRPRYWHIRAVWNGTIGILGAWDAGTVYPEHITNELIGPAWRTAIQLLASLGGYGPAYAQLRVEGNQALLGRFGRPMDVISLGRGPSEGPPTDASLEGIERELRRATGEASYEPEDRPAEP